MIHIGYTVYLQLKDEPMKRYSKRNQLEEVIDDVVLLKAAFFETTPGKTFFP